MKLSIVFTTLVFAFVGHSQLEDSQVDSLRAIWKKAYALEADSLVKIEKEAWRDGEFGMEVRLAYLKDTFILKHMYADLLSVDGTTFGMVRAIDLCEKDYDALLNKYYKLLSSKLEVEDRKTLLEAQRLWLKFREAERKINGLLYDEKYSGGGSIQQLFFAEQNLQYTKERVEAILGYLIRIN